jgi:hypothetical protein
MKVTYPYSAKCSFILDEVTLNECKKELLASFGETHHLTKEEIMVRMYFNIKKLEGFIMDNLSRELSDKILSSYGESFPPDKFLEYKGLLGI